jgi:hypothetical protein
MRPETLRSGMSESSRTSRQKNMPSAGSHRRSTSAAVSRSARACRAVPVAPSSRAIRASACSEAISSALKEGSSTANSPNPSSYPPSL